MSVRYTASDVDLVEADVVRPLRHRVLRPHQDFSATTYPGDDEPETLHAVIRSDGIVIGIVSIYRDPPEGVDDPRAWRLRGLAVAEESRGTGAGRAIMEWVIRELEQRDASFIWCSARSTAVAFYERFGFATEGSWYDEPLIGPHIRMRKWISAL